MRLIFALLLSTLGAACLTFFLGPTEPPPARAQAISADAPGLIPTEPTVLARSSPTTRLDPGEEIDASAVHQDHVESKIKDAITARNLSAAIDLIIIDAKCRFPHLQAQIPEKICYRVASEIPFLKNKIVHEGRIDPGLFAEISDLNATLDILSTPGFRTHGLSLSDEF
ncbi:MAG: hypothetical protein ACKOCZ_11885 [Betaproteobacteria bacterium]|nr:hypothetical protein [Betaproteobacteria bacterium]